MAALAATAVSLFPNRFAERYVGSVVPRNLVERRLAITGVTAGDTATAAVLGLSRLVSVSNAYNATGPAVATVAVDPVNNRILVGTGPSNVTLYLTVTGVPTLTP